ncbi:MAG: M1 family aminopeptidase, partial [Bacteroidota bacterium]
KEKWQGIDVSYYVDPPYGKYAPLIFGETPSMLSFFSERFGVKYPWEKFDQIAVHDYVSGAMENTTAVIHGTNMMIDPREVIEEDHIDFISHELAHHWFGDLVTCESWSNITLNEGFATYSEYLWREKRYGRTNADEHLRSDLISYVRSTKEEDPPLIRFHYGSREDVFDAVSYKKGGCVLHMLRKEVGDDAFFTSIKNYLEKYSFSSAEVNDLRIAFEKTTGKDMNWFFNQWFLRSDHPELEISYEWIDSSKTQRIIVNQKQEENYRLPLQVDFYFTDTIIRKVMDCNEGISVAEFEFENRPELVNVDAEKALVGEKTDKHSDAEWVYQYRHAPLFLDRFEAVSALSKDYKFGTPAAEVVFDALSDPSARIRLLALDKITVWAKKDSVRTKEMLKKIALSDPKSSVRVEALEMLKKKFSYPTYAEVVNECMDDSSYEVVAMAFEVISDKDSISAVKYASVLQKDSSDVIRIALAGYYSEKADTSVAGYFEKIMNESEGWEGYLIVKSYGDYLKKQQGAILENGINTIEHYCESHSSQFEKSAGVAAFRSLKNSIESKSTEIEKSIASEKSIGKKKSLEEERDLMVSQTDKLKNLILKYSDSPLEP